MKIMTEKVNKYRKHHKRCIFCIHLAIIPHRQFICKAKYKIMSNDSCFKTPRFFCSCYEIAKKEKEDDNGNNEEIYLI